MNPKKELILMGFDANERIIRKAINAIYPYGRGPGQVRYGFFDKGRDGHFTEVVIECDAANARSIAVRIGEEIFREN